MSAIICSVDEHEITEGGYIIERDDNNGQERIYCEKHYADKRWQEVDDDTKIKWVENLKGLITAMQAMGGVEEGKGEEGEEEEKKKAKILDYIITYKAPTAIALGVSNTVQSTTYSTASPGNAESAERKPKERNSE